MFSTGGAWLLCECTFGRRSDSHHFLERNCKFSEYEENNHTTLDLVEPSDAPSNPGHTVFTQSILLTTVAIAMPMEAPHMTKLRTVCRSICVHLLP